MRERHLKTVRLLAECMQGFERFSGAAVRRCGLTHAQFDILATLGNTPGMCYKELGQKTLITKGTLTGVIERLEQRGLVERSQGSADKRQFFVRLTPAGEALFAEVFPRVGQQVRQLFVGMAPAELAALEQSLQLFKHHIDQATLLDEDEDPVENSSAHG
jgi:DNA-binding MarR family transcriptional regulator